MAETLQNTFPSIDELQELVRNPEEFEKYFRKKAFNEHMGKGEWLSDGKKGYRFTLPDGSYVRIRFFDTIKKIFNSKNVEVPGRESWLSYIAVEVMPFGIKGYAFNTDMAQHVWALSKARPAGAAAASHAESIKKLKDKAANVGIDLSQPGSFEVYFQKHF